MRAELTKVTTTRGALGLLIGAIAVAALSAFSTTASTNAASIEQPLHEQQVFVLASINLGLFAVILGIRSFTDEFRHGTIAWTLLAVEPRWRVSAAKAAVSAVAATLMVSVAVLAIVAIASAVAAGKGAALGVAARDAVPIAGVLVSGALWAVLGVAVGALVRHQVAALVGAVIWVLVIENLAAGFLGDIGRILPGQAALGLAQASAAGDLLAPTVALVLLLCYVAVFLVAATATLSRRELAFAS